MTHKNTKTNVEEKARKAVSVIGTPSYYDNNGNPVIYNDHRDVYSGCGVYRVGWRNGKITCAIHGGFHDSCPYGINPTEWTRAVTKVMEEYADHIVKMDGSGTSFFFRYSEDSELVHATVKTYNVPSARGGLHKNIEVVGGQA